MDQQKRNFVEQIEVAGDQLADKVKELFQDANAKRVVIRDTHDRELLSIPLAFGVAGGALLAFTAPMIAAVAAIGAVVAKVKLEIERSEQTPPSV